MKPKFTPAQVAGYEMLMFKLKPILDGNRQFYTKRIDLVISVKDKALNYIDWIFADLAIMTPEFESRITEACLMVMNEFAHFPWDGKVWDDDLITYLGTVIPRIGVFLLENQNAEFILGTNPTSFEFWQQRRLPIYLYLRSKRVLRYRFTEEEFTDPKFVW